MPLPLNRGFAGLPMDDNVNGLVEGINVPAAKDLLGATITGRSRGVRIKEDTIMMEFEVRGSWHDGGGKFWRDFKAALLNQVMQPFDHGDGTEFRAVDCVDVAHTRSGQFLGSAGTNVEVMAYSAKMRSYEPFARSKVVALSGATSLQPARPAAPAVALVGVGNSVSYSYSLVAQYSTGDSIQSPNGTNANGPTTLSVSNYNAITLPALPTGATGWRVLRTIGGPTQGLLASGLGAGTYNDQGTVATVYTANTTWTTSLVIANPGTAFAEPTWQFSLVIPSGVTVTLVRIQNSTTGEICTVQSLTLTNGTYYILMDACGGNGVNSPNNNGYGLLAVASNGYGATVSGAGDVDFIGTPPTLAEATGVPPSATNNSITVTLIANGQLTSANLNYLAPSRWIR